MKFVYLCLLPLSLLVKLPFQKADTSAVAAATAVHKVTAPAIKNKSVDGHSTVVLNNPAFPVFDYPDTSGKKISLNAVKGKKQP